MAPAYNQPSVEPIVEDSEDESFSRPRGEIRGARVFGSASHQDPSSSQRYHISERDSNDKMPPARTAVSKAKSRKSHKSSSSSNIISSRHSTRKGKSQSSGQASSTVNDRETYPPLKRRHTHTSSGRAANSGGDSSGSDGEGPIEDHREVLAATRGRLTSPSVFSVQTSLTTATNTSSGSSGSNSTVTQASVSKASSGKRAEGDPSPPSPAAPDPPDVFAYMEHDSAPESFAPLTSPSPIPRDIKQSRHTSTSSASSSFHSDNASEQAVDVDTDRSTSPERSVKGGNDDDHENTWDTNAPSNHENDGYSPSASAKYEAQLLAAQERQSLHECGGRPNRLRHHPQSHYEQRSDSQALSPRPQPQPETIPPTPETIPLSGYNLIAQTLAQPTRKFSPIYRRFEALNHRVLLGLQDEIMELEDELKRLDDWDTNNRSFGVSVSVPPTNSSQTSTTSEASSSSSSSSSSRESEVQGYGISNENMDTTGTGNQLSNGRSTHIARHIHPSSRRHEVRYPSELSYSKTQLLQTLQYKLAQYNVHLKAFDDAASLGRPRGREIENYRQFLQWERPVIDSESRYIDEAVEEDLVVVGGGSGSLLRDRGRELGDIRDNSSTGTGLSISSDSVSTTGQQLSQNNDSSVAENPPPIDLPTLAMALAAAFLIPILTFGIIPNWLGRMTVVLLVGIGVWGGVWQSLSLTKGPDGGGGNSEGSGWMVGSDGLIVAGIYGAVMGIVAAIVG